MAEAGQRWDGDDAARSSERTSCQGQTVVIARSLKTILNTDHRWRNQYGGMKADDAKELRKLRDENQRLKRMVADQVLDLEILREVAQGNL